MFTSMGWMRPQPIFFLRFSHRLVPAEEQKFPRDLPTAVDATDPIEPFRIRGPGLPIEWVTQEDWHSQLQQGKRYSLLEKKLVD
jgi:hypothetical protein